MTTSDAKTPAPVSALPCGARAVAAVLTALLLLAAHPPTDFWPLAWVAFVPLLYILDDRSWKQAAGWGFFTGMLFYLGEFYWFTRMSGTAGIPVWLAWLAMVLLVIYLSLYMAAFCAGAAVFQKWGRFSRWLLVPAWWVALEWMRARLFSGFGWASLGYSQYRFLPVIQIAEFTGVFGLSFVIVLVNQLLKDAAGAVMGAPVRMPPGRRRLWAVTAGLSAVGIWLAVVGFGLWRLPQVSSPASARVSIVQGNVAQQEKWRPEAWPGILEKYFVLTQTVAKSRPVLIIWPETAFPGYIWQAPERYTELRDFVRTTAVPLLFGTITVDKGDFFNSAILLSAEGREVQTHHKLHLVPFGEYLPLRRLFPFLADILGMADFTPGKDVKLFPLEADSGEAGVSGGAQFGVLICFEDTVAPVARRIVQAGAGVLVNITNDAWFGDTKAPHLHLQAAVLRAVENRRTLVRATNTGVSGVVSPTGHVIPLVGVNGRSTYAEGTMTMDVALNSGETFYTKWGDVFVYLCLGCLLIGGIIGRK